MTLVLDASAAGPLFIPDESSALLPGLDAAVARDTVHAPAHWPIEMANLLLVASRRGRLAGSDLEVANDLLASLSIRYDDGNFYRSDGPAWRLAERHGLTAYDAAYLELAARLSVPLATNDQALMRAAAAESVALFGR